ncbi:MAG: hypothetical protein CMG60_01845 [Candidatus Marinimicrobia bacterium]|nr:hypothetical protein [Candidatus Neomarinimicrobiota bacterium]
MSIRDLGKQSLIYGFGHVLARLITFLLLPLYTHSFTQEEYGAVSLAYAFIGFGLILYRYGMDTALMKFSVQTTGDEKIKHITVIIISQIITGIMFTLIFYLSRNLSAYWVLGVHKPDWMVYLSIILLLDSLWSLPLLILRAEQKATLFISFSLLNVVVTMFLNILFVVHLKNGIEGVFKANILASGLLLFTSFPIIIQRIKISAFDKSTLIKVLKFAIPFLPAGVFTMVMELSDRYLIEYMLGTKDVGLYSAGKKMGMLGLTAVMGFNMGWTPYFLKKGKERGARLEFSKITTLFLGIMGYLSMLVSLWINEIMRLSIFGKTLIGPAFWNCNEVVSMILLGYFFFGTYIIQLPGIYIKEITNWVPIFRISGALTLIMSSFYFVPKFGFVGAAYSVVLAFVSMTLTIYLKLNPIYTTPYNWRAIFFPVLVLIGIQYNITELHVKLTLSFLYPIIWYLFIVTDIEKKGLVRLLK